MRVRVVEGDLLDQNVDAIVNAWNRNTLPWWGLSPAASERAILDELQGIESGVEVLVVRFRKA